MSEKAIGIMIWQLKGGGAERAVANLSRDLFGDFNVYIFLFDATDISYPYCGKIIDIKWKKEKNVIKRFFSFFKYFRFIKKQAKILKIDVMISFMQDSNRYNVLLGKTCKKIISFRNMLSLSYPKGFAKKMVEHCSKKADRIVTLSEGVKRDLVSYYSHIDEKKVITIYNSCDSEWFMRKNDEIDKIIDSFDFSNPVIVSVGRLTFQKGHWHLLRAFSVVSKHIPLSKLVIFGQGELRESLEKYAKALGIADKVFFMGFVKDYHAFVKKCSVFVFPSLFEGLGNVQLEALACDIPVISTDCDFGPREILDGLSDKKTDFIDYAEYGVLVKPFSLLAFDPCDISFEDSDLFLAQAIEKIVTDVSVNNHYRDKASIRKKFFHPDNIKNNWIRLIEEVLND